MRGRVNARVLPTSDTLRAEVEGGADECACEAVDKLARDAKVAELDLAVERDQDIGRFDVCAAVDWPKR